MKVQKKYKYAFPGTNKVVYGACEQESEVKNQNLDFWICKNKTFVKIILLMQKTKKQYSASMYVQI